MGFTKLGLSDRVMEGVRAAGYTVPTPIQELAIRPAIAGRDLIAGAQTGTGKTAAFVLPMLHRLSQDGIRHSAHRKPRALVLTPTRELALQVQLAASAYGRFLPLETASVYGGVGMAAQLKQLRRGVDIVVATPGRLLDHMQQRSIDLSRVEILVLDEADRMLDMGFIRDVRRIIDAIPRERQTLLFSATISPEIRDLAADILRSPQTIEVGERRNPAETVTQHFYAVPRELKTDVLAHAIEAENMGTILVFSRTKHGADKITRRLSRKGINAVAIHSNRTQGQRERALDGFRRGEFRVLVATDIAARGIDVAGISHVINYDVPQYAEDYIHRIGRTGRAGMTGDAVTFVSREEMEPLRRIERFIGKKLPVGPYPGAPAGVSGAGRANDASAPRDRHQPVPSAHADHAAEAGAQAKHHKPTRHAHPDRARSGRGTAQEHSRERGVREPARPRGGDGRVEQPGGHRAAHRDDTRRPGHGAPQEKRQRIEHKGGQRHAGQREHAAPDTGRGRRRRKHPAGKRSGRKSASSQSWSNYPR